MQLMKFLLSKISLSFAKCMRNPPFTSRDQIKTSKNDGKLFYQIFLLLNSIIKSFDNVFTAFNSLIYSLPPLTALIRCFHIHPRLSSFLRINVPSQVLLGERFSFTDLLDLHKKRSPILSPSHLHKRSLNFHAMLILLKDEWKSLCRDFKIKLRGIFLWWKIKSWLHPLLTHFSILIHRFHAKVVHIVSNRMRKSQVDADDGRDFHDDAHGAHDMSDIHDVPDRCEAHDICRVVRHAHDSWVYLSIVDVRFSPPSPVAMSSRYLYCSCGRHFAAMSLVRFAAWICQILPDLVRCCALLSRRCNSAVRYDDLVRDRIYQLHRWATFACTGPCMSRQNILFTIGTVSEKKERRKGNEKIFIFSCTFPPISDQLISFSVA